METIRRTPAQQLEDAIAATKRARGGPHRAKWTRDTRGLNHPSEAEAKFFDLHYQLEARGVVEILEVEPQWTITLPGADGKTHELCVVKGDLKVRYRADGVVKFIDYKGKQGDTPLSRLKHKMVLIQHGVTIELVGKYVERKAADKAERAMQRDLIKKAKRAGR